MTRTVLEQGTRINKTWRSRITGKHETFYGAYSPFADVVRVWWGGLSDDEIVRTMMHEFQHARDRRMIIVFRIFCYAALAVCSIFLGMILKLGNSFPMPIGIVCAACLWFISTTWYSWFEDRAVKAAKEFPYPKGFSGRFDCPQCSERFGAYDARVSQKGESRRASDVMGT